MGFALKLTVALTLAAPLAMAQPGGVASAPKGPVGMVDQPCPAPVAMPPAVRDLLTSLFMTPHTLGPTDIAKLTGDKAFGEYNAANRGYPGQDWAGLCRFRAANAAVIAAGKTPRIVFMGDSITDNWLLGDPALFNDSNINRGIGGQTTPQMLVRFRSDVLAQKPRIVHIMAGTEGELRNELGNDGVHPNYAGYAIMRTLLEKQLATMAK